MASSELFGRDHEAELIGQLVEQTLAGDGGVCLVIGPAGIGKSTLVDAAKRRCETAGFRVLKAVGSHLERELGFGVVRQLFAPIIASGDTAELMAGAAELAAIPLGLRQPVYEGGGATIAADPSSALHGLYWLTERLADEAPTLIVVDDAHWADAVSGQFIAYLASRLEGPILILVASRTAGAAGDPDFLAELQRLPDATIVKPQPLTPSEAGSLMIARGFDNGLDDEFVATCHQTTGGNPFLLRALITRLLADGATGSAAEVSRIGTLTPEDVVRWVSWRLRSAGKAAAARQSLDAEAPAHLASAYAVLDSGASLGEAAAIAKLELSDAADAADALIAAGILTRDGSYDFVHPLIRSAVYDSMGPARRAAAHLQAARLALDRDVQPAVIAAHLLASDPGDNDWTVVALRRAARDAVATGAPLSAVLYLERALRESVSRAVRAELLVALGDAQLHAGIAAGFDSLRDAIELEAPGRRRAEVYLKLGRALFPTGDHGASHRAFVAGLREDIANDDDLLIELSAWSVTNTSSDPVLDERAQSRLRLLVESSSPGQTRTDCLLLAYLAYRLAATGEQPAEVVVRLARRALESGALLKECVVDYAPYGAACGALGQAGEVGAALAALDSAVVASQKRGSRPAFGWFSFLRAASKYVRGYVRDAIDDLQQANDAMLAVSGRIRPDVRAMLAICLVECDQLKGAEEALVLSEEAQALLPMQPASITYNFALGRLRFAQGEFEQALEILLRCEEWASKTNNLNPAGHFAWRSEAALAAVALGQQRRAKEILADALPRARAFGAPVALAIVVRTTAIVEGGDLELLDEAVRLLEGSGADRELARTLTDQGAALRRASRHEDARMPLERARDLASRCGADAIKNRAHKELIAAGGRPRGERITGVESLTPSERRVAWLGADGLSNTQIAQQLFVTRRTVESHMTNTFRKLDITGRDQLRSILEEEGGYVGASG